MVLPTPTPVVSGSYVWVTPDLPTTLLIFTKDGTITFHHDGWHHVRLYGNGAIIDARLFLRGDVIYDIAFRPILDDVVIRTGDVDAIDVLRRDIQPSAQVNYTYYFDDNNTYINAVVFMFEDT